MIFLDFETYSDLDLTSVGTYRYAESCEPIVLAYAIDDGPVGVLDLTSSKVHDLRALTYGYPALVAHNAMFDRLVLGRFGIPSGIEQWQCTMAMALSHGLPGGLEKLGHIFGLPQDKAKDADGRKLVHLFCKPRPKSMKLRRATRRTHPQEWQRFLDYAGQDVVAMRELYKRMPKWNWQARDTALYHLDQTINDRGIGVDVEFARTAVAEVAREQERLDAEAHEQTDGAVSTLGQRDKLLTYVLDEYGVSLPDLQSATLERRINDYNLPPEVKHLLGLRLRGSTTSTSKYKALERATQNDGRLRGTLQFRGAARTGRWAGRVFQPQNLPRPTFKFPDIELFIETAKLGGAHLVFGDDVMPLAASSIRSAVIAPEGETLKVADLSNIEGRVCAWLAGEDWKLRAFRAFDAGEGPDLYKVAYGSSFKVDPMTVTKDQRQIGKVQELMLQYEGGVGAFLTGAATYGIDLDDMAWKALPAVPADVLDEARGFLDWRLRKGLGAYGLPENTFLACESIKRLWRRAHAGITNLWPRLKEAWLSACAEPNARIETERVTVERRGNWLTILLPSGRRLCYPDAKAHEGGGCSYLGVNQYTRQWERINTHGGKLLENVVQAIAYDILCEGLALAEERGLRPVLTVHDEIVAEGGTVEELVECMSAVPEWAKGLPLAAAGYETTRYRKED